LVGRGRQISEFKVSLVYKVSSRTAKAIQRNSFLEKQNKTKQNKTKQNKTKQKRMFVHAPWYMASSQRQRREWIQ
jgi:endonuclease IV